MNPLNPEILIKKTKQPEIEFYQNTLEDPILKEFSRFMPNYFGFEEQCISIENLMHGLDPAFTSIVDIKMGTSTIT